MNPRASMVLLSAVFISAAVGTGIEQREIKARASAGVLLGDANDLARALGLLMDHPTSSEVRLARGERKLVFKVGSFSATSAEGVERLDHFPIIDGSRWLVPMRKVVETFGGEVNWSPNQTIVTIGSSQYPVRLESETVVGGQAFEKFLMRVDSFPIPLEEARSGAIFGETMHSFSGFGIDTLKLAAPTLRALGGSKILELVGEIPAIGSPIKIAQLAFQATDEIILVCEWLHDTDRRLIKPFREMVIALSQIKESRSEADLPAAVRTISATRVTCGEYRARLGSLVAGISTLEGLTTKWSVGSEEDARLAALSGPFDVIRETLRNGRRSVMEFNVQVNFFDAYLGLLQKDGDTALRK